MQWVRATALVAGAAVMAGGADAQTKQQVTGPVATYWMSAKTTSGFGGMMGGGERPSMASMMGAAMGGGSNVSKTLSLQLGSSRKAPAAPAAEHVPPAALRAGQSLPLLTPRAQPKQRVEETPAAMPENYKPKGRMLIFWGCGQHAKAGQPIVIDFAKMAAGQAPAGLEALSRSLAVTAMQPPSPGRNATYGEWPNEKTRITVPAGGSLIGDHLIRGNYSPDIQFALTPGQDFLGPLQLTSNAASGQLSWNPVANARGYLATAVGAGEDETMVMWSSSEIQASAFALPEYLSNADLARLVASKALMGPAVTNCTIPQEVLRIAPQAMVQLAAYGGETNISYPPRPADPKTPWNIDWTLKVRYKSQTATMLGMDMAGMGGGEEAGSPEGRGQKPQSPLGAPGLGGAILRGLGGRLPGL
ncbi:MAG: hypothetical protein V4514_04265 [Pseudomonadota bacterium]|uniref:hypothetical protein n=1 Tax=Phenylobacterium sp. TaxID=1871053 RepID=UPI0025D7B5B1|nr:hypothetical protein [Phenylobacterium sp.]MBT9471830.1 hypothetical protein [Phenylobacterium sp.]